MIRHSLNGTHLSNGMHLSHVKHLLHGDGANLIVVNYSTVVIYRLVSKLSDGSKLPNDSHLLHGGRLSDCGKMLKGIHLSNGRQ